MKGGLRKFYTHKGLDEKINGGVFHARWTNGKSTEVRMRHIIENDYGKKAQPEAPDRNGLPGFPRRTMIRE